MKELWLPVSGYEGLYEVSNHGQVKGCKKTRAATNHHGHTNYIEMEERILRPSKTPQGYRRVVLSKCNKLKTHSVHRLVMTAFKPNVSDLPQINHIDGNKDNNRIDNLEWCSASHNVQHSFDKGLNIKKKGWDNNLSKAVRHIIEGKEVGEYGSIGQASLAIGLKRELISNSCRKGVAILKGRHKGAKFVFA